MKPHILKDMNTIMKYFSWVQNVYQLHQNAMIKKY